MSCCMTLSYLVLCWEVMVLHDVPCMSSHGELAYARCCLDHFLRCMHEVLVLFYLSLPANPGHVFPELQIVRRPVDTLLAKG